MQEFVYMPTFQFTKLEGTRPAGAGRLYAHVSSIALIESKPPGMTRELNMVMMSVLVNNHPSGMGNLAHQSK